jgi:hypothetical protein
MMTEVIGSPLQGAIFERQAAGNQKSRFDPVRTMKAPVCNETMVPNRNA